MSGNSSEWDELCDRVQVLLDKVADLEHRLEGIEKLEVDLRIKGVVKPVIILARPETPSPFQIVK